MTDKPLLVLSLGAGVQSSCLALMAEHGEIEKPDCAIFADTGAEPPHVIEWLDWLETQVSYPIHRVMWKDGLYENIKGAIQGGRFAGAPFFTEADVGGAGLLRRQCTREFKVQPITRKLRELVGLKYRQRAPKRVIIKQYIGISLDEAIRMKPSREKWIEHTWPLVDLGMRRLDCLQWMDKHGYPRPKKSSCTFCPYHGNDEWRYLRDNSPEGWQQAIEVDKMIRSGVRGTTQRLFVHRDMVPLEEADLDSATNQLDMFGEECEGMCGV